MKTGLFRSRILSVLILGALIGISIWFGAARASTETFHHKDIAYLEKKQNNAKALSASASAVSVLVSLLPQDTATPLANQISDIGRDFLIVLSALAAEQQLLTITGRIAFCWIIPIALGILILFVLLRRKMFLQIGVKLALAGIVLYMLVPVTLRITRLADSSYDEVVDNSLQQSKEIEDAFHYNESGIVMPGMSGSTAALQTEGEAQSEAQTGLLTEVQTELQTKTQTGLLTEVQTELQTKTQTGLLTEVQTEIQTKAQTESHTEAQTGLLTETQTELQARAQTELQTEARKQTEKPEKKQKKKTKKKQPWYEKLWKGITGFFSGEDETASPETDEVIKTEERKQVQTEQPEKKQKEKKEKKQPWYERLWKAIAGLFSSAADTASKVADTASKLPGKVADTATQVSGQVVDAAVQLPGRVADTAAGVAKKVSETSSAAVDKVVEAGESAGAMVAMVPELPQMTADLLDSLIDAFVLMIVTTCVLPIFVLIGLLWVTSQVLNINPDWEKMKT